MTGPRFGGENNHRPLLVLCDLASQERMHWETAVDFIGRLTTVLAQARAAGLPVAYCERAGFDSRGWPAPLAECRPHTKDMVFERAAASCFSSHDFRASAEEFRHSGLLFAGLGAAKGVLASALDAHALGMEAGVLIDLCGSSANEEPDPHQALFGMLIILQWLGLDLDSDALFPSEP